MRNNPAAAICRSLLRCALTELLDVLLERLAVFRQRGELAARYRTIIENGMGAGARAERPG